TDRPCRNGASYRHPCGRSARGTAAGGLGGPELCGSCRCHRHSDRNSDVPPRPGPRGPANPDRRRRGAETEDCEMSREPFAIDAAALHAYADGQLNEAERAAVERHLAEHPEAVSEVAAWQ